MVHGLMQHIDLAQFLTNVKETRESFASAEPFPHIVLDNFLRPEACEGLLQDYLVAEQGADWNKYHHYNERKEGLTSAEQMGSHTRSVLDELASEEFLKWLEVLSGVSGLVWDEDLDGGGFHRIGRGGYLNVHADFLAHTKKKNWSRQLNLLIYLNHDWKSEYGGNLELWDAEMVAAKALVPPLFNRCVIFRTTEHSYHGHPDPLACPEGQYRRSLALYYFRPEDHTLALRPTHYRARPHESALKKTLVVADRIAIRSFSVIKRYTGLKDQHVAKILRAFRKAP